MITILGSLLDRPVIKNDFETKYVILLDLLGTEMDVTKQIFDKQIKNKNENKSIELHRNLPEVSGLLRWCHELKERIMKPMTTNLLLVHSNNGANMLVNYQMIIWKRIC